MQWTPLYQVSEKSFIMTEKDSLKFEYVLKYIHTFQFSPIKNLYESEMFNIKYQSPDVISTIAERLRYYRHKKSLLQKDVAKYAGINECTYISYENPERDYYPIDSLAKIAKLYEIDLIKLLDDYNLFLYRGQGKQVKKLRKKLNLTQKELSYRLNVHHKTLAKWEKDKTRMPKGMYLQFFINRLSLF